MSFRSPDAFVVADGVGGGAWGEVASAMLAQAMSALFRPDEHAVQAAMVKLDSDIAAKLQSLGDDAGASVVACLWPLGSGNDEHLASWVGDCQLSHWQPNRAGWTLSWSSTEQSYERFGLLPPAGVPAHSPANMVGCGMGLPVSHHRLHFNTYERMVLSSDGFWRSVNTAQIADFMNRFNAQLPADAAEQLCAMALREGSQDDISVLVIEKINAIPSPMYRSARKYAPVLTLLGLAMATLAAWSIWQHGWLG